MAKYYGTIGYAVMEESQTSPGIWMDTIVEKSHYGDVIRRSSRWQMAQQVNDNLVMNVQISIMADTYATQNYSSIKYAVWEGVKWKVITAEPQRPRIILTLGGVYNGN